MADFNWDDAGTGAAVGGTTGASVGTAIFPGVGTLIGGAVGAVGGGIIGGVSGQEGGLMGTLAGYTDPDARYEGVAADQRGMVTNEGVLRDWAYSGRGPSAAQNLLARNRSDGQQRALSNAKSLSGGNAALAGQMANRQQAQVSADTGLQSATLRAQEQQSAMQAYQAAMETRRQQNIDVAKQLSDADRDKAEKKAEFVGGLISGGASAIGGMFG